MLAAVVPSVNAKWEIKEVSIPKPRANQVLIKMHASGICYTDVRELIAEAGPCSVIFHN
jgi:dehydrogenase